LELPYKKKRWDLKSSYPLNLRKTTLVTLVVFNLIVLLSPRIGFYLPDANTTAILTIDVENIPITRQNRQASPPPRPSVPIPTDDESIPEDETIEETNLKYTNLFDYTSDTMPGMPGIKVTPPRPIAWVFPEFPESEKKRGVQGVIKLSIHVSDKGKVIEVVVLDNSTNSVKCAEAAVAAAYGSRFLPAREGGKSISYWVTQPYRFDSHD